LTYLFHLKFLTRAFARFIRCLIQIEIKLYYLNKTPDEASAILAKSRVKNFKWNK